MLKPIKCVDMLSTKKYTRKQVQRIADKQAKKSYLPGAIGVVWEGNDYFRYTVAGKA